MARKLPPIHPGEILAEEFLHQVLVLKRGQAEGNGKADTADAAAPALSR